MFISDSILQYFSAININNGAFYLITSSLLIPAVELFAVSHYFYKKIVSDRFSFPIFRTCFLSFRKMIYLIAQAVEIQFLKIALFFFYVCEMCVSHSYTCAF